MARRITGKSFDITMAARIVHLVSGSLSITDNSTAASTGGVPDGIAPGSVTAEGEMEVDTKAFNLLGEIAREYGSWRDLPAFDLMFYANTGDEEFKVEAFGCYFNISDLLSIDPNGGSLTTHKVKYFVTDPNFIRINGVPYLSSTDTRHLLG